MPLRPYDDPLRVASRKKKEQLKAKQFMTSDVAYTGKKEKKKILDKRKGKKMPFRGKKYATGGSVSRGQYASQPNKVKFKGVF